MLKQLTIPNTYFFNCLFIFLSFSVVQAQKYGKITGRILHIETLKPLKKVEVSIKNLSLSVQTNKLGVFNLENVPFGKHLLAVSHKNYDTQIFEINLQASVLDLGTIYFYQTFDKIDFEEPITEQNIFLFGTDDVFLKRASFDFSQSFFSLRGYEARHTQISLNNISLSNNFDGFPQWQSVSRLYDITRQRQTVIGLSPDNENFGSLSGTTKINTNPAYFRGGYRLSGSYSNKNYTGSIMATYHSGLLKNTLAYSFSASRQWGEEGYIAGTLYDAYSLYGAVSYKFNPKHSIVLSGFFTPSRRGKVTAITQRVYEQFGRKYNPLWGWQEGEKRNSSMQNNQSHTVILNYAYQEKNTSLTANVAYLQNNNAASKLDFINVPNPFPNYWKYLPDIADNPQINWLQLYEINLNTDNLPDAGNARYMLYNQHSNYQKLAANMIVKRTLNDKINFSAKINYNRQYSDNFARPKDLLGAEFFTDVNPFTTIDNKPTKNDALGVLQKGLKDKIKYNYSLTGSHYGAFVQLAYKTRRYSGFISGNFKRTTYLRQGKFLNEAYPENSLGKSSKPAFNNAGIKMGLKYDIDSIHQVSINGLFSTRPPLAKNTFINARENNNIVPDIKSENSTSLELNYRFNHPLLQGRLTAYATQIKNATSVNAFFAEIGSGIDYFQEVTSKINKRYFGLELGLEYQVLDNFSTSLVAALGEHVYNNNPEVGINFNTADLNEDMIHPTGFKDLGKAYIKNYKLANGPQQVFSLGGFYSNPKNWWLQGTANYFSQGYLAVSNTTRTSDFYNNPQNYGQPYEDIDFNLVKQLLKQERFNPYILCNISAGKWWQYKGLRIKLVASIHNLFDTKYISGGYEQARIANYGALVADTQNGASERNFGPKYWYGFGRTYFINLALSLNKSSKAKNYVNSF